VALTSPYYPPYVNILTALGMRPVIPEAGADTRFQPSVAMLERLDPPPDGLIVASPCNPAGTMLHPDELSDIAAWCDRSGVRLISDEIYHGLNYDSPIATAASFSPNAIVVNSFSKYFAMTGWRLGYAVVPPSLIETYGQLVINTISCAPTFVQVGAVEALTGPQDDVEAMVVAFDERRRHIVNGLNEIPGIRCATPTGAFYVFPEVSGTGLSGAEFACSTSLSNAALS